MQQLTQTVPARRPMRRGGGKGGEGNRRFRLAGLAAVQDRSWLQVTSQVYHRHMNQAFWGLLATRNPIEG